MPAPNAPGAPPASSREDARVRKVNLATVLAEELEDEGVEPPELPEGAESEWGEADLRAFYESGGKARPSYGADAWTYRGAGDEGNITVRLLCFHHAGGSNAFFKQWIDKSLFPPYFEVVAVDLPGRAKLVGKDCWRRLRPCVEDLCDALAGVLNDDSDVKTVFFGHSLGAYVAFELARELRRRKWRLPDKLIVSARTAPHFRVDQIGPPYLTGIEDDDEFVVAMADAYQSPDLIRVAGPQVAAGKAKSQAVRTLRADMEMYENYLPAYSEPPLPCAISAYAGKSDHANPVAMVKEWEQHTAKTFQFQAFAGGHFYWRPDATALVNSIVTETALLACS